MPSAAAITGRMPFSFFTGPGLRDIATIGPLKLTAKCTITPGPAGEDSAEVQLSTAVDGAAMDGNQGDEFKVFNVNDNPAEVLTTGEVSNGTPEIESNLGDLGAFAPDGTTIATENLVVGVNVAGHTGQCSFGGTVVKLG